MYLVGTESDDLLVGGADADTLVGLGGDDTLQGGEGDDLLIGGAGYDTLDGGAGSDTVSYEDAEPAGMFGFLLVNLPGQYASMIGPNGGPLDTLVSVENVIGSSGADWLVGTAGDNHLSGGDGNDIIEGKGGVDVLDGGAGNDNIVTGGIFGAAAPGSLLIGGEGVDSLQSGNSNDTMMGGAGDDYLQVQNYATTRVIDGGVGTDALSFGDGLTAFAGGVVFDLSQATAQTVASGVVVTVSGVENVYGSFGNDVLIGDAGANLLRGGNGDDTLYGGDGNDILEGSFGNNTIDGGAGIDTATYATYAYGLVQAVTVNLATGEAEFVTDGAATYEDTLADIENVIGSNGADVIIGDAGANFIRGGNGDDTIEGGAGQDLLDGEAGADTFVFRSGDSDVAAPDTILFFGGDDRIQFLDGPAGSASNYVELEQPDPAAVDALFAGEGVRYVAMQAGSTVFLYADLGEEGTTYDQLIILTGSHVMSIDASSILGL